MKTTAGSPFRIENRAEGKAIEKEIRAAFGYCMDNREITGVIVFLNESSKRLLFLGVGVRDD